MPRLFESHAETALVFSTGSRLTAGFDFPSVGDVAFHKTASIFVINLTHMIMTKLAYLAARCTLASCALSFATRRCFGSSLHGLFSSVPQKGISSGFSGKAVRVVEKGVAIVCTPCRIALSTARPRLRIEHFHIVGNNFYCCAIYTILIGILTLRQTTFDIDFGAFVQVLLAYLSELAPGDDIEPL